MAKLALVPWPSVWHALVLGQGNSRETLVYIDEFPSSWLVCCLLGPTPLQGFARVWDAVLSLLLLETRHI